MVYTRSSIAYWYNASNLHDNEAKHGFPVSSTGHCMALAAAMFRSRCHLARARRQAAIEQERQAQRNDEARKRRDALISEMVAAGKSTKEIGAAIGFSPRYVAHCIDRINRWKRWEADGNLGAEGSVQSGGRLGADVSDA